MDRLIKRYRNRKLYDTKSKEYINLSDIAQMLKNNETIQVIDNATKEDVTRSVLTQIILKGDSPVGSMPVETLRVLITQGEATLKKALHKTLRFGKDVADIVEQDFVRSPKKTTKKSGKESSSLELETILSQFEKVGDWVSGIVSNNLKNNLLKIPSHDDWQRVSEKIDVLEEQIQKLMKEESQDGK